MNENEKQVKKMYPMASDTGEINCKWERVLFQLSSKNICLKQWQNS